MRRPLDALPQLGGTRFVTDGGLETTLVFHHGIDLPHFAACVLLEDEEGTERLRRYYAGYAQIARDHELGIVLESPTWRANPAWLDRLGYPAGALRDLNLRAADLMASVRDELESDATPVVISGCIGPHDDGYSPGEVLSAAAAEDYHARQIGVFADSEADLATAITMTYAEEAIGVTRAARAAELPVAISFTVETDGRLPSGQSLAEAIAQVDDEAGGGPDYYMLNCAHPEHLLPALERDAAWLGRIGGLRANASRQSHAELDEATELDDGDPVELAADHAPLLELLPAVAVLGGCCGTDHRHVRALAEGWAG